MKLCTHHDCRCARARELMAMADMADQRGDARTGTTLIALAVDLHRNEVEVRCRREQESTP